MLSKHPLVERSPEPSPAGILRFWQGEWLREVGVGLVGGLVELADNNPMVCADRWEVPDPWSVFALVGLAPLARAGLILEPPTLQASLPPPDEEAVAWHLAAYGWHEGVLLAEEATLHERVAAASAMAVIEPPACWSELDGIYDECFGRSFCVRRASEEDWTAEAIAGTSRLVYRLRVTPGEGSALVTVQMLADRDGKLGAGQLVHAMNVMSGLEESLGLAL